MFMIALLSSLGCGFDKLLRDVDSEATRAGANGDKKFFRIGDDSPQNRHLHTGTPDCPMKFDVQLDPKDWRKLAFQAIRTQVYDTSDGRLTLESLVNRLESRQRSWHAAADAELGMNAATDLIDKPDSTCVQLTKNVRNMIDDMPD